MAFPIFTPEVPALGAGEIQNRSASIILSQTSFASDLTAGLFVRWDGDTLQRVDGTATPSLVGVAVRDLGAAFNAQLYPELAPSYTEHLYQGAITVTVKAGEEPEMFGAVYVSNEGDEDDGKATSTDTDVASTAIFLQEKKPVTATEDGVWLVLLG